MPTTTAENSLHNDAQHPVQQQPKPSNQQTAPAESNDSTRCSTNNNPDQQQQHNSPASVNRSNRAVRVRLSQQEIDEELIAMAKHAKQHKRWNRRLKLFFCCLGYKKNKDSIADIASIFAEFFSVDLNVPSSDVAAGFVLLAKYQEAQRQWILKHQKNNSKGVKVEQFLSGASVTEETKFLDIKTAEDSHLVNDLIYYMNYSSAIFGWPLQAFEEPCTLCCIYPYLRPVAPCRNSRRRRSSQIQKQQDDTPPDNGNKENAVAVNDDKNKKKRKKSKDKHAPEEQQLTNEAEQQAVGSSEEPHQALVKDNKQQKGAIDDGKHKTPVGELDEDCDKPIILEDNCCSCNIASADRRLAAHNYELIYVTYRAAVGVVPFLVAADHAKQTIVVAIRGSMSLGDMVTDMNGTIDKLPLENCPDDWLCHRGITRAANYVKTTLNEEHILERAFNCRPDLGSQEYDLLFCGHSLGAGAAAILGVLMRPQYPNLKAYLYSPPGGILSLPVVEYTKQFAIGVVLGNDSVARLGMAQLERLKYQVLLSLKTSDKSTRKILTKAICPTMCFGTNKVDYDPEQSLDLLYGTEANPFDYDGITIPFQDQAHVLYVPGRLIHVVRNHSFKAKTRRLFNEPIYQAIWANNEDFDRVMIGKGMLYDHLPHNVMHAMKMLFSKTLPARRESRLSQQLAAENISSIPNGLDPVGKGPHQSQPGDVRSTIGFQVQHVAEKEPKALAEDNNNNGGEINHNDGEEIDRKLYPHLSSHSSSSERLHHQPHAQQQQQQQTAGEVKKIGQDLDENGNEKTSL